jgi:hypothetical protein
MLSCGSWACTPEDLEDFILALAEALDLDPGEAVTVLATDTTPPSVKLRAIYDGTDVSVDGAFSSTPVSLGLQTGQYYWLEVIAEDPEGVRSVGVRSGCRRTSCQKGDLGSLTSCSSLDPDSDWPEDLVNHAQPGEQANTRMVWFALVAKEPTEWTTSSGWRCTRPPPVWGGRATTFSGMSTMAGSIRP